MEATVLKMEAQLRLWNAKIEHLAAKTQVAGAQARFETLVRIDELKALHAIAESKLTAFKAAALVAAAGDTKRTRLRAEMKKAWNELEAAISDPTPSP